MNKNLTKSILTVTFACFVAVLAIPNGQAYGWQVEEQSQEGSEKAQVPQEGEKGGQSELSESEKIAAQTKALVEKLKAERAERAKAVEAEGEQEVEVDPIVFEPSIELPEGVKQVFPTSELWLDKANNQVIVGGKICIKEGPLEMFACPRNTKEHESVVSVNATSFQVHATFLAMGCNPGEPVTWDPEYKPASGPRIDMDVAWKEGDEIKRIPVQQMIRNFRTKRAMETHFVFGGSQFYVHQNGRKEYYGDSGEMVCLSNFSTATMDIPIQSVNDDNALLFEAFTENIPPVNTQVYIFFRPQIEEEEEEEEAEENTEDKAERKPDVEKEAEAGALKEAMKELEQAALDAEIPAPQLELVVPDGWTKGELRPLPEADHGFTVPYGHESGLSLTLYQFTRGHDVIPNDVNSELVVQEMQSAKSGIAQLVDLGIWQNAKERKSEVVRLGDSQQNALWCQYDLTVDGKTVASDIYVWSKSNTLFKIRCTSQSEDAPNTQKIIHSLLTAFGNSNEQ